MAIPNRKASRLKPLLCAAALTAMALLLVVSSSSFVESLTGVQQLTRWQASAARSAPTPETSLEIPPSETLGVADAPSPLDGQGGSSLKRQPPATAAPTAERPSASAPTAEPPSASAPSASAASSGNQAASGGRAPATAQLTSSSGRRPVEPVRLAGDNWPPFHPERTEPTKAPTEPASPPGETLSKDWPVLESRVVLAAMNEPPVLMPPGVAPASNARVAAPPFHALPPATAAPREEPRPPAYGYSTITAAPTPIRDTSVRPLPAVDPAADDGNSLRSGRMATQAQIRPDPQQHFLALQPPGQEEELEKPPAQPPEEDEAAPARQPDSQTKIGQAPAQPDNQLQFLRSNTILLEPGQYRYDITFQYVNDQTDFTLADLSRTPPVVAEANNRRRLVTMPLEFRLGITPKLQGFVNVPFGWASTEVVFAGIDETSNTAGIGDVNFGFTRQLIEGDGDFPDVLGVFSVSAPTGQVSLGSALTTVPVPGSNLGEGFWSMTSGLTFINAYEPVVFFYGAGYRHRFANTIDGVSIAPGNQIFYRFGAGFAVNSYVTFSGSFSGSYIFENYVQGVRVAGSNREPLMIRLAATINRQTEKCHPRGKPRTIEPFVNFGITDDAVDTIVGTSWTY